MVRRRLGPISVARQAQRGRLLPAAALPSEILFSLYVLHTGLMLAMQLEQEPAKSKQPCPRILMQARLPASAQTSTASPRARPVEPCGQRL